MWTFNVTRELVRAAGFGVVPELVPNNDEEMVRIGGDRVDAPSSREVAVLKIHVRMRPDTPHSLFIVPRRDLRDSLISFMRFTGADFERGLVFVKAARIIEKHYAGFAPDRVLFLDYADITGAPAKVVEAIAGFLGLPLKGGVLAQVVETYSKSRIAGRIAARDQEIALKRADGLPLTAGEAIAAMPGQIRAFDPSTGFQSGHVSDYVDGTWREILTPKQRAELDALLA